MTLRFKYYIFLFSVIFLAGGCATTTSLPETGPTSTRTTITTTTTTTTTPAAATQKKGIYHKVHKGETIWRIAQAYNVNIDEIIQSNNIPNVANVEQNQLLFIPGADSVKDIVAIQEDLNKNEFIWPVKGKVVSYFGERRGAQFSRGVGIHADVGEDVLAAREGKVVFADFLTGYANTVILDHLDGYYTVYGQNSALLAKAGDYVYKGTPIAKAGRKDSVPYLYFEIRKHAMADNPLYYLPQK
jgi:murein DD-endopeptidase MepM/ murein hydrolase activator NlpD